MRISKHWLDGFVQPFRGVAPMTPFSGFAGVAAQSPDGLKGFFQLHCLHNALNGGEILEYDVVDSISREFLPAVHSSWLQYMRHFQVFLSTSAYLPTIFLPIWKKYDKRRNYSHTQHRIDVCLPR